MKKKIEIEDTIPGVPVGDFVEEFLTKPYTDEDGVQVTSGIRRDGKEYGDPVPMSPPVGLKPPEDLMTTIRRMVQHEEFNRLADKEGFDTFEEAGDYDMEDDHEFTDDLTPHEALFYPPDEKQAPPEPAKAEPIPAPVAASSAPPPSNPTSTSSTST